MKKMLLAGAAAISIAVVGFAGPANAACYWTGYNWDCAAQRAYQQPYNAYQYAPQPQSYYGYAQPHYGYYGQYPQWNSTRYPGPRAGGGGY